MGIDKDKITVTKLLINTAKDEKENSNNDNEKIQKLQAENICYTEAKGMLPTRNS